MIPKLTYRLLSLSAAAAIAAVTWLAAAPGAWTAADAKELKLAHFMSPKHPMHRFLMAPMVEDLAAVSGGKLTIKIYPAGALGKGPREQYNRVVDGIADIVFGIPGYTSPQFPRTLIAELPDIAQNPQDITQRMWKAYPQYLKDDFKDVKVLALWTNERTILIMREKAVHKLEDLAGLKIRAPSKLAAGLLAAWGAVPQTMPVTKVYTSMQTGVIDGVFIGSSAIRSFKLAEVGKYFTTNLPPTYTTFYLLMNRSSWDGLSGDEQAMLEKVSGQGASLKAAEAYGKAGKAGIEVARKAGRTIIALSAAERKRFAEAAKAAVAAALDEREGKGIPAKAILATLKSE